MLDWQGWKAVPAQPVSPLHLAALAGKSPGPAALQLVATGKPMPVLEFAAQNCFWSLNKETLSKLAKALLLPVAAGSSLADLCKLLVQEVLQSTPLQEQAAILSERGSRVGGLLPNDVPVDVIEGAFEDTEDRDA
eukprot:15476959-Alexandrium_andersonii.AAC.1